MTLTGGEKQPQLAIEALFENSLHRASKSLFNWSEHNFFPQERYNRGMVVTFLFLDESLNMGTAWLTGLLVPAGRYPDIRDAVIRITHNILIAAGHTYPSPTELHGSEMLKMVTGVTDQLRLQVFEEVVMLVNQERVQILSVGHSEARNVQRNLKALEMDHGDKLFTPNLQRMVDILNLTPEVMVFPVFDGIPGQRVGAKSKTPVDQFAHQAFLRGINLTHWCRVMLEEKPIQGLEHKPNLRNLAEPTFVDSTQSPLLQLADVIGYLLGVPERVQREGGSAFKRKVAAVAEGIDPHLVHRREIAVTFVSSVPS